MTVKKDSTETQPELTFAERVAIATAPGWRPEPGETLEKATVIRMSMGESDWGPYPVITYRTQDGKYVRVHVFHQLLRERLAELKTDIGSVQNLTYIERRTGNTVKANGDVTEYELYYAENDGDTMNAVEVAPDFKF